MTLACADVNSNILDVGTVADVHDEKLVDSGLVEIWKPKFGQDIEAVFRSCS